MKNEKVSSCIDVSFISSSWAAKFFWCTDLETRGSDHYPVLLSYLDKDALREGAKVKCTNWEAYEESVGHSITASTSDDDIIPIIARCLRESSRVMKRPTNVRNDEEYERLRAIRRRAERKARRTKTLEDMQHARRAQRHVRRHLEKLNRQRWQEFCAKLDVRKPLSHIWRVVKGMRNNISQLRPFSALSLHENISQREAAEEYCKLLSATTSARTRPQLNYFRPPPAAVPALDHPFSIQELNAAISDVKKRSSPGYDEITYEAISHLSHHSRLRLLEYYNATWLHGIVPPDWKLAKITSVLKPGKPPTRYDSFRPIALLSCIGKLMEK